MPPGIYTDQRRLHQVLKNLLSNVFKFTERGRVAISISQTRNGWNSDNQVLSNAESVVAFSVRDTGIGIALDKHRIIFEAFQQADGTITRRYGGTGLGLSISREIATLLEGEIQLESKLGEGSSFTLYLPLSYTPDPKKPRSVAAQAAEMALAAKEPDLEAIVVDNSVEDDRASIEATDRSLLIIEDDLNFARIMMEMARERGFKVIVANRGDVGLRLARQYTPSAITLDIELPGMDGWSVLDRLKHTKATRHIPVHIISVAEERQRGLKMGAVAFENKPVTPEAIRDTLGKIDSFVRRGVKNLLVIEDDKVA